MKSEYCIFKMLLPFKKRTSNISCFVLTTTWTWLEGWHSCKRVSSLKGKFWEWGVGGDVWEEASCPRICSVYMIGAGAAFSSWWAPGLRPTLGHARSGRTAQRGGSAVCGVLQVCFSVIPACGLLALEAPLQGEFLLRGLVKWLFFL